MSGDKKVHWKVDVMVGQSDKLMVGQLVVMTADLWALQKVVRLVGEKVEEMADLMDKKMAESRVH